MEKRHYELAPMEHWYLVALAVNPEHQGKGYASKLLKERLPAIDKQGLPCYLETMLREPIIDKMKSRSDCI